MKIIFLNIDWVLNSEKWYIERFDKNLYPNLENYPLCEFDPLAIEQLNLLTDKTNAKIVISSTWRMGRTIDELKKLFEEVGIKGEIIGITPHLTFSDGHGVDRGNEIKRWIDINCKRWYNEIFGEDDSEKFNLESYVILDDDPDMLLEQKDNFVRTSWRDGLTALHTRKAIKILNTTLNND